MVAGPAEAFTFTPPDPLPDVQTIKDLELLPVALSAFLALLAVIGLLFGVPLGIALGRAIWRAVAGFTPLAAWPQRRAARLHAGQVLRSE